MMHAGDLLSERAELTPNREALLEAATGRRFTFAELNARANRAADFLRVRLGVEPGDRVCLLAHNGVAYVDLLYGLMKIGAILVPLNWRLVAAELSYIINDCRPKVLFCGPEFAATPAELRPLTGPLQCVSLEGAAIDGAIDYEGGLAPASDAEPERPPLTGDTPACIVYTSGTTGRPKGAVIPHRQVLWNCINTAVSWELTGDDVSAVLTPMFHTGGLFVFLTPLFYTGGRIIITREFDAAESLRLIERERCTVVLGVPTLFQMWLDELHREAPEPAGIDFSHMRWFISGGAPCPVSLLRAWHEATGVPFHQGYGLTEAGPNCFTMTDEESVEKTGSIGKPVFHSRARLVDPDGTDVAPGETGELIIHGPHVCAGYRQLPDATAAAFNGGWLHTGDIGRRDDDGFYYIVGRFKDMLISGGENIYAAEVEAVFLEHPAVMQAALIGRPDNKWGEVGLMIVVAAAVADRATAEAELLDFCRGRLAAYKVPRQVIFTDALPFSPYGKVEKIKLKERYLSHADD